MSRLILCILLISIFCISIVSADENNTTASLEEGSNMLAGAVNSWISPMIVPFVLLGCFLFVAWLYGIKA
jgi:uncharacterized membrane protein